MIAAIEICANRARSTCVGQQTFVDVAATVVRIALVAQATSARMIAERIEAVGVDAAGSVAGAFVNVRAQNFSIAMKAFVALTFPVARLVAAPSVGHALRRIRRIEAFVDVVAMQPIAVIAVPAAALETADRVVACREHIAWPIIAFVLV